MNFTPEEIEASRQQDERQRKLAEAKKRAQQKAASTRAAAPSNNNNAIAQAAKSASKKPRENGLITNIGNAVDSVINGDWMNDGLNAVAAGINQITPEGSPLKDFTKGLDNNIRSQQELDAATSKREKQVAQSGSLLEKATQGTATNLEAVSSGIAGGLQLPTTIAARLANQNNPWADPPAHLKDSPVAQSIFEVAQVLTPTLLSGGVAAGYGASAVGSSVLGLTAESALETATQDSFDDLLAGRKLAEAFGNIAESQGFDGAALTRELIEGQTPNSQVLTAAIGLVQNFGINFGADRLIKYFPKAVKALRGGDVEDRAAVILGRSSDDVDKAVGDINNPLYDQLSEPHEVVDLDSAVPVSKASAGNTAISNEALVRQAVSNTAEDGTGRAGRSYFTNWSSIVDDNSLQKVLQEATSTLKRLKSFPDDLKGAMVRAGDWWETNKGMIDTNFDGMAVNFTDLVKTLESKEGIVKMLKSSDKFDLETYLKEYSATTEEGFIAASLVGEELGVRIQKLAKQAVSLDDNGVDFSAAIENILNLHDKVNLFLIPLRRGKRKWAVEGALQQRNQIKRIKDADVQGAVRKADPISSDAPGRSFETIKVDDADPGSTMRELWDAYQAGDDAAGSTLKRYLNLIAYSDPSTAVSQVAGLNNVLSDALKKGNKDAGTQLMYFSMLSRASTQTASAASNIARLVGEPLGAIISGEKAYGFGQLVGGWSSLADSQQVLRRALVEGRATNAGSKIDELTKDLAKEQQLLDDRFTGALKELHQSGASKMDIFGAHMSHWFQTAANHPLVHAPGRLLMSADEWTKSVVANQIAVGRAYKEIAELGIKDATQQKRIIDNHIKMVFRDGVKSGKIIDADVLAVAKHLTFQQDIPVGGNFVDNAFLGIKEAADNSGFWKFVSPFTRVSYAVLETTARYEPTGAFRALAPKYKAIMAGEMGETAQLQLKSQIAMGQTWAALAVMGATAGMVTGVNSGNLPKQSILIPASNEEGYIAIPYGKLEPFASLTSVIADVVNGVKNDVIGEGEYDRFLSNIVFSLGMASFDKTFMSGMADFGSLFDAKNLSSGSLTGAANITSIVSPGVIRMVTNWAYPYKTISGMEGDAWQNFIGAWRQRAIGGIGNPIRYDELTGKPIPSVATMGKGDNYWALVIGSALNEFIYPGKITKADKNDPVKRELDAIGFKHDSYSSLRTFNGIALSPEQQSILSKDMSDVGYLRGSLLSYFESSGYKRLRSEFQAMRKADSRIGSSSSGTRANAVRDIIHSQIKSIYRAAKDKAATEGRLANDADFQRLRYQAEGVSSLAPPTQDSGLVGLLNWVNK